MATIKPIIEAVYVDKNGKTHSKYYTSTMRDLSESEFQLIKSKDVRWLRQGYLHSNKWEIETNAPELAEELAMSVIMDFGEFRCRYLIHSIKKCLKTDNNGNLYADVKQPKGIRRGYAVTFERKSCDELEEERIEFNFPRHKFLEDAIV